MKGTNSKTNNDDYCAYKKLADGFIEESASELFSPSPKLLTAAKYLLLSGGKRLRPVIFLAAYLGNCVSIHPVLDVSSDMAKIGHKINLSIKKLCFSIEALHTYTLIHDDLPCMDNDSTRRGMPSCHVQFGEAHALLAGDALLNGAAEFALEAVRLSPDILPATLYFFKETGMNGIVGGQSMEFENAELSRDRMLEIIKYKTAALFKASAVMGGLCARLPQDDIVLLEKFGYNYGMGFQLADDISDLNKKGFASMFGLKKAKSLCEDYLATAKKAAKKLKNAFFYALTASLEDSL